MIHNGIGSVELRMAESRFEDRRGGLTSGNRELSEIREERQTARAEVRRLETSADSLNRDLLDNAGEFDEFIPLFSDVEEIQTDMKRNAIELESQQILVDKAQVEQGEIFSLLRTDDRSGRSGVRAAEEMISDRAAMQGSKRA